MFIFENVTLAGNTELRAVASNGTEDALTIEKVSEKPKEYTLVVEKAVDENVAQWFAAQPKVVRELVIREGYLSVEDPLEIVYQYPAGKNAVNETIQKPLSLAHPAMAARMNTGGAMSFHSIWNHISKMLPDEAIFMLNEKLNKIPK